MRVALTNKFVSAYAWCIGNSIFFCRSEPCVCPNGKQAETFWIVQGKCEHTVSPYRGVIKNVAGYLICFDKIYLRRYYDWPILFIKFYLKNTLVCRDTQGNTALYIYVDCCMYGRYFITLFSICVFRTLPAIYCGLRSCHILMIFNRIE